MAEPKDSPVRVAVEGCGHGCLHDIYASVEKAATLKGWDGVDLLIIGGDFQAVRNSNDMACMSVPAKYKEIGDFHEYYSGKRTAPYLTIFIGGNHEASNHLFELYYGGWVAPNIYYLGAANVLRYGPLRIAGFSGIWKGYDYRKPHFERIPYNREDLGSIYHVREIDIRKLLQIRTQVDIGLSHDWPKQVEYSGNWQQLFSVKPFFREDSQSGRLGSQAAQYVLERLRPAYWFSAHLHVKFAASVEHVLHNHHGLDGAALTAMIPGEEEEGQQQLQSNRAAAQSDVHNSDEINLKLDSDSEGEDGAQTEAPPHTADEKARVATAPNTQATEFVPPQSDFDSTNTPRLLSAWNNFHQVAAENEAAENSRFLSEQKNKPGPTTLDVQHHNVTWRKVDTDSDGLGRKLASVERSGPSEKKQKVQHMSQSVKNSDEIDLSLDSDSDRDEKTAEPFAIKDTSNKAENNSQAKAYPLAQKHHPEISQDVRNLLPSSFHTPQATPESAPAALPFPEAITNKTTNFLALDKCLPNRQFLQLLEIDPVSEKNEPQAQRPFQLQYDKEWLAITRVFANDLQLGNPAARPPFDQGEAVYKPLIQEEEKWVEENIVKAGKLAVPDNFTPTAPVYDPEIPVTTEQQPPEYNNPQTAAFCELVGIENKFHLTDEERNARLEAGPRPCDPSTLRRGRGGFRGRGGGRGRGSSYGRGFGRGGGRR
ncbi:lariat debranching enzyme, C-terminal domain-containing protein [Aspergillus unguis]